MNIKKTIVYITGLICITLIPLLISAQDETEQLVTLRLVCIETIGCLYTPLDDETLDNQFGTELERFEAGGDFSPLGLWDILFEEDINCTDPLDDYRAEGMKLITAIDDSLDVHVQDSFGQTNSRYTRLGAGVYAGIDIFADSVTLNEFIEYLIMLDETSIQVLQIGVSRIGDDQQAIASQSCFIYLGAQ